MITQRFLSLLDLPKNDVRGIVRRAIELKQQPCSRSDLLRHRTPALIFDKSSTRTRVAFEVATRS